MSLSLEFAFRFLTGISGPNWAREKLTGPFLPLLDSGYHGVWGGLRRAVPEEPGRRAPASLLWARHVMGQACDGPRSPMRAHT